MLAYDAEAARYDETRGGGPRADAAAAAVESLLPAGVRSLLDIACGTGIATVRLDRPERRVYGLDRSAGMLGVAATRMPGRLVRGDAGAIPWPDASLDAVVAIWLLHLADGVPGIVAEVARVLRPGGTFVTTVDKDAAHDVGSDVDALLAPYRSGRARDAYPVIVDLAARGGLEPAGESAFDGHGQGVAPRRAAANVRRGYYASRARIGDPEALAAALDALPDPDVSRGDPRYRLAAFRRH